MKRICLFSAASLLAFASLAPAQDGTGNAAAIASRQEAEENYNTLKGHVEDLIAAQADQEKQLQSIRKEIEDLRLQMSKPTGNYASVDDLKQLATAVEELDKKREADKELILKEIEKVGQSAAVPIPNPPRSNPHPPADPGSGPTGPAANENGFYYPIKKGDTLGLIAQAYREQQGIKVTAKQIEEANPNINPAKLKVGTKIFIPAPTAK